MTTTYNLCFKGVLLLASFFFFLNKINFEDGSENDKATVRIYFTRFQEVFNYTPCTTLAGPFYHREGNDIFQYLV